jgi:CDP-diglyceride synthetase
MSCLILLFFPKLNPEEPSYHLALGFFIIIWLNDTFAYLAGTKLGNMGGGLRWIYFQCGRGIRNFILSYGY